MIGLVLAATLGFATPATPQTVTLAPTDDTYLKTGSKNKNQGDEASLRVRSSGKNRALIRFSQAEIEAAVGSGSFFSATLEVYVEQNSNNWGSDGREVDVHRLNEDWSDLGATWNCPIDTDTGNGSADCPTQWAGGLFEEDPAATYLQENDATGWISLDVTADVGAFLAGTPNYGWLIKKEEEGQNGQVEYTSRDGTAGQHPRLIVTSESSTFDEVAPRIQFTAPTLPVIINEPSPTLALSYLDLGSGIVESTFQLTIDGGDETAACSVAAGAATCTPPPLSAGVHEIVARVEDGFGNEGVATLSLELFLGSGPHMLIFDAVADSYLRQGHPNKNQGDDAIMRVKASGNNRAYVRFDESEIQTLLGTDPVISATLELYIEHNSNNWSNDGRSVDVHRASEAWTEDEITWKCGIDTNTLNQQPDCATQWAGGTYEAAVSDTVLHTKGLLGWVQWDVTNDLNAILAGTTNHGWVVKKTEEGQAGRVHYTSREGTEGQRPRLIVVAQGGGGPAAPVVTIDSPTEGAFVQGPTLTVTGTVVHDTAVTVDVSGVAATVTDQGGGSFIFAADLTVADGPLAITVTASDGATNASATVNVTVDSVVPTLDVTSPTDGLVTNASTVQVQGTLSDDASVTLTLNGQPVTITGGSFDHAFTLSSGGNTLTLVATDAAGNETTTSFTVTLDSTGPTIQIQEPPDGALIAASSVPATVSYSDAEGIDTATFSATLDGNAQAGFTVGATSATGTLSGLAEGTHTLSVQIADTAGNTATDSVSFVVDTQPPAVSITSPADGTSTSGTSITVTGAVSDTNAVTVTVNATVASVSGGSFTADVALGVEGPTSIIATATDAAGNTADASVTMSVDRTPPAVSITSPVEGAFVQGPAIAVTGSVADATPVAVDVNGQTATITGATFNVTVPASDGSFDVVATAVDDAGNVTTEQITITVDSAAPSITLTEPADGFVTNQTSVTLAGTVTDVSAVTLRIDGDLVPVSSGSFSHVVTLPGEGSQTVSLEATDAAGNVGSLDRAVVVDQTPPTIDIASPTTGALITALPLVVQGTATDATAVTVSVEGQAATLTGSAYQASLSGLPEGAQTLDVTGTDAAGNQATATVGVVVDLQAPVVTITSPATGTLTNDPAVTVTGSVTDVSSTSVTVNGQAAGSGAGTFGFTAALTLSEGDDFLVASATDAAGRTSEAQVVVTLDTTPPTIDIVAPDSITRSTPETVTATVLDEVAVAQVVFRLDGAELGSFTQAPYSVEVEVPETANAGDTLTLAVEATDTAGNTTTEAASITVASDGVIVGQILDDETGFPIEGASVQVGSEATSTDEMGRYVSRSSDASSLIVASFPGMTTVERRVDVESGVGTVPVDARLTQVADSVIVGVDGGVIGVGETALHVALPLSRIVVPPGAVSADAGFQLTPLSAQGLPGLLPLGFTPVSALDIRADAPVGASLTAEYDSGLPDRTLHLVEYRFTTHEWHVVATDLILASGALSVTLPSIGTFALVEVDVTDPVLEVSVGDMLAGSDVVELPITATATGTVDPPVVAPTGEGALGTVEVSSPLALPSGTVVSTEVTEEYELASGDTVTTEPRSQDVVLYRPDPDAGTTGHPAKSALNARIPITPSETFDSSELTAGRVHLDVLAGREMVRGRVGGNVATTVESGDGRLNVSAGALAEDAAIALDEAALSAFLPSDASVVPLSEFVVDTSGQTLSLPAELSVEFAGVDPADTLVLARVERVLGVARLAVVAIAELQADRIVTIAHPDLPGITDEGRYVFYRVPALGFVNGATSSTAGPLKAVVETSTLPFIGLSEGDGSYVVATAAGPIDLTATVPSTALFGNASTTVIEGQTTTLDISLVGAVTMATATPADGSIAVSTGTTIDIAASAAVDATTVTSSTIELFEGDPAGGQTVAVRFVISGTGRVISVVPEAALQFDTEYTLVASGVLDQFGELVQVPQTTFRTRDDVPPVYDFEAIGFSFPDENGLVDVTAPAGTLPPGTTVLIINTGNGIVATFTAGNDGSISGQMPATIDDQLFVTVTDPFGNETTFTRSKFVAADGTTAIGPGGGTVDGPGGVQLRVPEGAAKKGVRLSITSLTAAELETLFPGQVPDFPDATLGSGLQVDSEDEPTFETEVDLVFPLPEGLPANPEDAFFYVYRRLQGPDGKYLFETIDQAFVEGTGPDAKIVTASPPFGGYFNSFGAFDPSGGISTTVSNHFFLMWTFDSLIPGRAGIGTITGTVRRQRFDLEAGQPAFDPIGNAVVSGADPAGLPLFQAGLGATVAYSQPDGTYTMWDASYDGGTVTVTATSAGETRTATAFEVNPADLPGLDLFQKAATADITFPPIEPPPPPPDISIEVLLDLGGGARQPTTGVVVDGTPLVIRFETDDGNTINAASIDGNPFVTVLDTQSPAPEGRVAFVVQGGFTPSGIGSHTVEATALDNMTLQSVTGKSTFLVVSNAGAGAVNLPDEAPKVITDTVFPKASAKGVSVDVLPRLSFSEPVRNVTASSVQLTSAAGAVDIKLIGVAADGQVFDDLMDPGQAITALTIEPRQSLKFSSEYTLTLTTGIEDLDESAPGVAAPKSLEQPFSTVFTTFGPEALDSDLPDEDKFASAGMAVFGDRAYVVENRFTSGTLIEYDLSDPLLPDRTGAQEAFAPRPVDVTGFEDASQKLVAVAVGPTNKSLPSSVLLFDVEGGGIRWVGAASVTGSSQEGFIQRVALDGDFAYVASFRKGVQIVDLAQMQQLFPDPTDFPAIGDIRFKINANGQGFGQSAVQQTIPIPTNPANGAHYSLSDIDVRNFQGGTKIVVSGQMGLATIDTLTGQVVSSGSVATSDGTTELKWGRASALTDLAGRDVAVVAGNFGPPGDPAAPGFEGLAVVDLSSLGAPQILGLTQLDTSGFAISDLLLKDGQAFVGLQSGALDTGKVLVVALGDGTTPSLAGSINGVGGRLAFGQEGLLFSSVQSAFGTFGTPVELGGVRSAVLEPTPVIPAPRRTIAKRAAGEDVTLDDIDVNLRVYPRDTPIDQASLQLFLDGVPLGAPAAVAMSAGAGVLKIAKGFTKPADSLLSAIMSFFIEGQGGKSSAVRTVPIGALKLILDSNNDTVIDDADEASSETAFAFWESEDDALNEDNLIDFATVHIRLDQDLATDEQIGLLLEDSDWQLRNKVRRSHLLPSIPAPPVDCEEERKLQFCSADGAEHQKRLIRGTGPVVPENLGAGLIKIPPVLLQRGTNSFVFRCNGGPGRAGCPVPELQLVQIQGNQSVALESTKIDIRPIDEWFSVYSARPKQEEVDSGAAPSPFTPRPTLRLEEGRAPIPSDTGTVTLLVHGFNVSESGDDRFFRTYMRRLYWAGHAVLPVQTDDVGRHAYTIGLAWPGAQKTFPFTEAGFFPEDEFNALQTGISLSRFVETDLPAATGGVAPKVSVIAHSLGNMAVNSALQYLQPGAIDNYVMNEAAVAAEAFDSTYEYSPLERAIMLPHAISLGYSAELLQQPPPQDAQPHDKRWGLEWEAMEAGSPPIIDEVTGEIIGPDFGDRDGWNTTIGANPTFPRPKYEVRWQQIRPPVLPEVDVTGEPARGPWRGFFAANRFKARTLNTWNRTDQVLTIEGGILALPTPTTAAHAWRASQLLQKPTVRETALREISETFSLGLLADNRHTQFWADLGGHTGPEQEYTWGGGNHSNITRQWAELAFWFPSLSRAAGAGELGKVCNEEFTEIGGNDAFNPFGLTNPTSQGYMTSKSFRETWAAYRTIQAFLASDEAPDGCAAP